MTTEVCGDNRFEIIEKAKQAIIESTNIETSPEEMAVLDNILFRCWQMGWLDKYGNQQPDGDLISRQDAVKEIDSFCGEVWTESEADFARGLGTALSIVESLPSAEQVTGKLKNPCDSLLTDDSEACKEQKSKLDLISRQDALAEFRDGRDVYDIMESIEELPSAPDSRQRGEWVYNPNAYDYGLPAWECDQCGCINANIPPRIMTKDGKPNYAPVNPNSFSGSNFCPNCGARMYKGGDSDAD